MSRRGRHGLRIGFSLPEIIVSVAIFAIIAAVLIPQVSRTTAAASTVDRANQAAVTLDQLARAIAFFEATKPAFSFHQTLGVYPGKLSHLVTPITTSQTNDCSVPYTTGQVSSWPGHNYYSVNIPTTGYKLADGFVTQDSLIRSPANAASVSAGILYIVVPAVARSDAAALARIVDNDSTGTVGAVRYTASGESPVTVNYRIEIGGC